MGHASSLEKGSLIPIIPGLGNLLLHALLTGHRDVYICAILVQSLPRTNVCAVSLTQPQGKVMGAGSLAMMACSTSLGSEWGLALRSQCLVPVNDE